MLPWVACRGENCVVLTLLLGPQQGGCCPGLPQHLPLPPQDLARHLWSSSMPLPRPLTFQASADPGWAFTGCPDGMVACSPQYLVLGSDIAMGHSYSLLANAPILPNGRLRTAAGGSPPNQVRCGVLSGKTSRAVRELGGPPLLLLTPCGSSAVPSVCQGHTLLWLQRGHCGQAVSRYWEGWRSVSPALWPVDGL